MVNKNMTKLSEEELNCISGGDISVGIIAGISAMCGLTVSLTGCIPITLLREDAGMGLSHTRFFGELVGNVVGVAALIRIGYAWAKRKYKKKCKSKK